jgi:hypothetical protein
MSDFIGNIGGLEFVSGVEAFKEAAHAQREGRFGRSEAGTQSNQVLPVSEESSAEIDSITDTPGSSTDR